MIYNGADGVTRSKNEENVRALVDWAVLCTPLPLVLLLITQAEIEAEHRLKCFHFALLKLGNTRWIN